MGEFKSKVIEALNLIINAELVEGHNGIYEIIWSRTTIQTIDVRD